MLGVAMSEPNAPSWAKPMSSSSTTTTWGRPTGLGRGGNAATDSLNVRPMRAPVDASIVTADPSDLEVGEVEGQVRRRQAAAHPEDGPRDEPGGRRRQVEHGGG